MKTEQYYLVDGDHMHGPMLWDDLRAMLESGTVGVDAQWCREGETEFRPLSELMALASAYAKPPPPPPVIQMQSAPPVQVFVTVNHPEPRRRKGVLASIASAIAAPVAVVIGLGFAGLFLALLLLVWYAESVPNSAKAIAVATGPKVQASVLIEEDSILVENAGTNTWRGAVITLEPGFSSYKLRIADFAPKQSGEFRLSMFTTSSGDRFPAAQKMPTMVMVQAEGMDSSVYRVR